MSTNATSSTSPRPMKRRSINPSPSPMTDKQSPTAFALNFLAQSSVSLPTPLRPILVQPTKDIIRLLPKLSHHHKITSALQTSDKAPLSARFKFTLTGSDLISKTTAFKEISAEAEKIIQETQQSLKKIILKSQQLELQHTKLAILNNLIDAISNFTKAHCVWTDKSQNIEFSSTAFIVITILNNDMIKNMLSYDNNYIINTVTTRVGIASQPTTQLETLSQDIGKTITTIVLDSIEAFTKQQAHNNKLERIEALILESQSELATASTAMNIENEEVIDPKSIQKLINDAVAKKTRSLSDQIKALKNKPRGASTSAPSTKQSHKKVANLTQQKKPKKVDDNNNGSKKGNTNNKRKTSSSRKQFSKK